MRTRATRRLDTGYRVAVKIRLLSVEWKLLKKCPSEFSGDFKDFFERFVEPNLPSVERVRLFDRLISEYLNAASPAYMVRMVRGMNRENVFSNIHHDRILGADNSPGIWLHAVLCGSQPISENAVELFERVPRHMFRIPKIENLRGAGYHLAHIISAKNGDTRWETWNKKELERRFLLNVHPCNLFLVAKADWRKNGGRSDIIDWIKSAYLERYGDLYASFVERVGGESHKLSMGELPLSYSYPLFQNEVFQPRKTQMNQASKMKTKHGYAIKHQTLDAKRVFVRERLIGLEAKLDLKAMGGRFLVPHDELWRWVENETNVSNTRSWSEHGYYHWPRPSARMLKFLDDFRISA